jgi:hypothetical protein
MEPISPWIDGLFVEHPAIRVLAGAILVLAGLFAAKNSGNLVCSFLCMILDAGMLAYPWVRAWLESF